MKRKALSLVMVVSMILSLICVTPVMAQMSGTCGENVSWKLDDNGVLTISGSGRMEDYDLLLRLKSLPWQSERDNINTIVVEEGVTNIGDYVLSGNSVTKIYIPKSITEIGTSMYFENGVDIYYAGSQDEIPLRTGIGGAKFTYNTKYEATEHHNADSAAEEKQIRILINNKFLSTDQPPVLINDRTMVPLRAIFEALGADVDWNDTEKSVTAKKDETAVYMQIGNNAITVSGNTVELDVPAQIVNDRTMVPVRAVAEAFDCMVSWNGYQKYVIIIPENQQPYRINAVNTDNEVVATASFDDKGRLSEISGAETQWFAPFCTNINGNAYVAENDWIYYAFQRNDNPIKFEYNNDGTVASISCGDKSHEYPEYENGVYSYRTSWSLRGVNFDCKYLQNECQLSEPNQHTGKPDKYVFNSMGLLEEYEFFSSGTWARSYQYNDLGQMIAEKYNGGGNQTTTYTYDSDGRLSSAEHREPISNGQYDGNVTYTYVTE